MVEEHLDLKRLEGVIKVREWPNWLDHNDETEFLTWRKTLTEKEWDKYTAIIRVPEMKYNIFTHEEEWTGEYMEALEAHNLITNLGINACLQVLARGVQAQLQVISQIMSVGNIVIAGVSRADTGVQGDGFGTNARRVPNSLNIMGTQADVGTNYLSGDANGNWSNLGWYGWRYADSTAASTTTGSGQLNTHCQFSYTKGASAVTVNYVYVLSN